MALSLQKGQRISLEKEAGQSLSKVVLGLGWDAIKKKGFLSSLFGGGNEIDLDASCVLFDQDRKLVDVVWFRQLQSRDGSILHTGDNRTGSGDGDDEQIIVDLAKVPVHVASLMFVVNSFTGQTFEQVENAYVRLVNGQNNQEVARFDLSCQGSHTAQVMCKVYRHSNEWKMQAIGENARGRTFDELLPEMLKNL